MDVVYLLCNSKVKNLELRYSMRSLAEHLTWIRKVWIFYDTAGLQPGDELRVVLQADATTLPTGRYAWQTSLTTGSGNAAA